jgi:hypothetical protein
VDPDRKLEPFTVSVKARAPAGALLGEMEPTLGVGFGVGVGAGVGVGVAVAPDPELQPAAAMNKTAISSPATILNAEFIFFNIARLPQISASAG